MAVGTIVRNIGVLFGYEVDRNSEQQAENSVNELKNLASSLLSAIGITFSVSGIKAAITDCVSLASEIGEMQNKFDVVFHGMTDEVEEWAQTFADSIGRNVNDIKTYISDQQNLLVGFTDGSDDARRASAELAEEMTSLALDLASFGNTDESLTVERMTKAVMGETESAKSLGAVLNETTRAEAMLRMGLSGTYDSLDQYTKMTVNLNAIQYQSADAIGDCERSSSSYESTLRQFQSRLKEIKQIIGQFFLPTFQKVYSYLNKGLTIIRNWLNQLSSFADKVGGSEKVIAVFGSALAAVVALFSVKTISTFISKLIQLAGGLSLSATAAMGLFVAFLLVALLIEDFIAFMKGEDSLLGEIFKKAGIDCDEMRQKVIDTWNAIKQAFATAADNIKQKVGSLFDTLGRFWAANGDEILAAVGEAILVVINKLSEFVQWISDNWDTISLIGGTILKAVATFYVLRKAVSTVTNIVKTAKAVFTALKTAFAAFKVALSALASPIGIAIAVIIAIIAVLQDLFNFMNGKDSIIGRIFEKFGIDSEAAREKMTQAWETIKSTLSGVWETLKSKAEEIFSALQSFWNEHGDSIMSALITVWNAIKSVLTTVWNVIKTVATDVFGGITSFFSKHGQQLLTSFSNIWNAIQTILLTAWNVIKTVATVVFGALSAFWNSWGGTIIALFSGLWDTISSALSGAWEIIKAVVGAALDFITNLFAVFSDLLSGNWSQLWEDVKALFSDIWNGIVNIVSTVLETIWNVISNTFTTIFGTISDVLNGIWNVVTSIFTNIWNAVVEKVTGIKDSIVEGFQAAIDFITGLPAQAIQWGSDIINGIISGIKSAVGGIADAVSGVADSIKSFLGFSEPEEGPLSDFHTYMPDMIDSMVAGIENGQPTVQSAMTSLAAGIENVMNQLPAKALKWGQDIMNNLVLGITSSMGQLTSAVSTVAQTIDNYVGFSEPEEGPLSNFHTYMPDMIQLMAEGINNGRSTVQSALGTLSNDMSAIVNGGAVSAGTASVLSSSSQTNNTTVTQNVNINNQFNGDTAGQQKSSTAMDKAATDSTSAMARALAFAK